MEILEMLPLHWQSVKKIYNEGIATGNATFETTIPSYPEWDKAHLKSARLVAIENGNIEGWAAITSVSGRCVYDGVGEVSLYVSESSRGNGIGRKLLNVLIEKSESIGLWTLQAGIFPENIASIRVHEICGFRLVGRREKIGKLDGVWKDTLLFEKRSNCSTFE